MTQAWKSSSAGRSPLFPGLPLCLREGIHLPAGAVRCSWPPGSLGLRHALGTVPRAIMAGYFVSRRSYGPWVRS